MIHRKSSFRAQKSLANRVLSNSKIQVIFNSVVNTIEGNLKVEKPTFESLGNDTTITMKCDQYILAISQESEINIDDLVNFEKGIFAAGDVVSENKTVVYAIKSGKEVAKKVIEYLNTKCIVED
jgi:thioredoxin reductase